MKSKTTLLALALAGTALLGASLDAAAAESEAARRDRVAQQLVDRWSGYVEQTFQTKAGDWKAAMKPLLQEAPINDLERAVNAGSFTEMNDMLLGQQQANGGMSTKTLGDADRDLVYVPVTPCRLFDTRVAGGIIGTGTERSFDVTAVSNYSFQGGAATDCGIGSAGSFAAVAVNITVVTPNAQGFVTAFPLNTPRPLAASIAFTPGAIVSNEVILKLDQGPSAAEMVVYSSANTHLVGDVTGYFTSVAVPHMECVETAQTIDSVAAGATKNTTAPNCATGYVQTSTNCQSSTWQMPFVYFTGGICSAQNNSSGTAQLRASRTCCRVVP